MEKSIKMYGINYYSIDENGRMTFEFVMTHKDEVLRDMLFRKVETVSGKTFICAKTEFNLPI